MAGQASRRLPGYSAYGGTRRDRRNYSVNIFPPTSLLHLPVCVSSSVRPLLLCLHGQTLCQCCVQCVHRKQNSQSRIQTPALSCFKLKLAYVTHQCARDGTRVAMLNLDLLCRGPIHAFGSRLNKTVCDSVLTIYFSFCCRYHSAATLRTMVAYRIGRKPMGPWISKTPPIRGGIFRKSSLHTEPEIPDMSISDPESSSDTDDYSDELSSTNTPASLSQCSSPSLSSIDGPGARIPGLSLGLGQKGLRRRIASSSASSVGAASPPTNCPVKYTDWAVQQGIEKGLRDYPSLDPKVQQGVVNRYRALHQQIRDEGLYNCRYVEYGKEMLRYTTLFACFLFALHHGWYMTSAVFLGLFWVSASRICLI